MEKLSPIEAIADINNQFPLNDLHHTRATVSQDQRQISVFVEKLTKEELQVIYTILAQANFIYARTSVDFWPDAKIYFTSRLADYLNYIPQED